MTPGAAPWPAEWLASTAHPRSSLLWRGVEAQHIVATMRLVDTLEEQAVLEALLEASKPALPAAAQGGSRRRAERAGRTPVDDAPQPESTQGVQPQPHYLLSTPFRYRSPFPSRFRRPHRPGVWYGAETLLAAAAEVAYWRWRFLMESTGLRTSELHTEHSFFQASVAGPAIDLSATPWDSLRGLWTQDRDYSATHALAEAAREAGLHWLRYESVRQPGGHNAAVFNAGALSLHQPHWPQTWHCKTTAHSVWLVREEERHAWRFGQDAPGPAPLR